MPKQYDVNDVNAYITDVMRLPKYQRVTLWYSIVYGPLPQHPEAMLGRFGRHNTWVQANILFRFGPIMDKIVREAAQQHALLARQADDDG